MVGSGRIREKLCNIAQYLQLKKHKEAGANKNRTGTVIKGMGCTKINPAPPCHPLSYISDIESM